MFETKQIREHTEESRWETKETWDDIKKTKFQRGFLRLFF